MQTRKSERHSVTLTAQLTNDFYKSIQVNVHDLSVDGAKISHSEAKFDKEASVDFQLPHLLALKADVVWSDGQEFGLSFQHTSAEVEEFIYNIAIYGTGGL